MHLRSDPPTHLRDGTTGRTMCRIEYLLPDPPRLPWEPPPYRVVGPRSPEVTCRWCKLERNRRLLRFNGRTITNRGRVADVTWADRLRDWIESTSR